jgi:4-amino-4-deoxychorismate lyase
MSPLLLETIRIKNGEVENIAWHNRRFNQTRKELFQIELPICLENFIIPPFTHGLYRCRILYNQSIQKIEYFPYQIKTFKRLKITPSHIDYAYKYANREPLNQLLHPLYDDVIIEKNGFLTDTSIANIAFYDGLQWSTPKTPLLKGTMREKLLSESFLTLKNIEKKEIHRFSHFALMNAMIGFQIQKNIIIE